MGEVQGAFVRCFAIDAVFLDQGENQIGNNLQGLNETATFLSSKFLTTSSDGNQRPALSKPTFRPEVLSDKLEHPKKAPQVNHHAAQKLNHSMRAALRFCL